MDLMSLGGIGSLIYSLFQGGSGSQDAEMKSSYSPGQQKLLGKATNTAMNMDYPDINNNPQYQQQNDWLMSMFNDPDFFKNFEAPIYRDFEENTMPSLTNRFAGMGSGGGHQSSAFRNQVAREGTNLHEKLAGMRGNMQQNAIPQLQNSAQMPNNQYMNLLNSTLGNRENDMYQPANNSMGNMAGPLLQMLMQQSSNNMMR